MLNEPKLGGSEALPSWGSLSRAGDGYTSNNQKSEGAEEKMQWEEGWIVPGEREHGVLSPLGDISTQRRHHWARPVGPCRWWVV